MACYLGNTVTRAAVSNEQLAQLLGPELIQAVVRAALAEMGVVVARARLAYGDAVEVTTQAGDVIRVGANLRVRVGGYGGISVVADRVAQALGAAADARFAGLVAETLREVTGATVAARQAAVQGQQGVAYVLTAER